jgi:hypothetical protein
MRFAISRVQVTIGVFAAWLGLLGGAHVAWSAQQEPGSGWKADEEGYKNTIVPFLRKYCAECHSGLKAKGDFHTDAGGANNFLDPAARQAWSSVVDMLNGRQMPPKKSIQPPLAEMAKVVDWITAESVRAELVRRDHAVVIRRMNREEYRNTIFDLIGIEVDPAVFPQDPSAGGFDNNGSALSLSPVLLEAYISAARRILDQALVEGNRPRAIKWRFEPKNVQADTLRVRLDAQNTAYVHGGVNRMDGKWLIVRNEAWNTSFGAKGYRAPVAGTYAIRLHAASRVPGREEVVESAVKALKFRHDKHDKENPKLKGTHAGEDKQTLAHVRTDRSYEYGPPRLKLTLNLGGVPRIVSEFDVDAPRSAPKVYEFRTLFNTEIAAMRFDYAYSIPAELAYSWMQTLEVFARPEVFVDWFEIEGPLYDAWPPSSHQAILFRAAAKGSNERAYARSVLERFMRKAYRRPVTPREVDAKLALFDRAHKDKKFLEAIKLPLTAVLSSPHFLFLAEPAAGGEPGPKALDNYELASRLSYFLWSSMPDQELSLLAERGRLTDKATRLAQVDRMLADPKALALAHNFAGQWLGLREIGINPPAHELYPQYDRHLELSIAGESEMFFREILANDLDARNLVKSDFVVINERLARFYGIEGVKGDHFRRVAVPDGVQRGGVATQASMLCLTSNGTRTSPVKRGTWVLKNLLGTDPGLPVSDAGEIAAKVPGIEKATVRKRLEIHRESEQCARCHNKIDPLGFALENYNAAGEWRDREGFGFAGRVRENDPKIDASSVMPDGRPINGVRGLQAAILEQEDLFLGCLASKMLTYALGRELGLSDQPTIAAAAGQMKREKYTIRSLLKFIVLSEAFETK